MIIYLAIGSIVVTAGILTGIVLPSLSGEHYDYFNMIHLSPNDSTQALKMTLNSSDTLYYKFRATDYVVLWIEDPAGNQVVAPQVHLYIKYSGGFKLVAESSGEYSMVFSSNVPDRQQAGAVVVEVQSGVTPAS